MKTLTGKNPRLTLLGAGPGDPELLTLKAVNALNDADVVLYDSLVSEEILLHAAQALQVFVGKRVGKHSHSQDEINELIVNYALEYGHVVRVKGGDPFVFGRGKEEELYALEHGINVNVIPGISSSVAVPATLGIPVTSRGVADSFWVITGTTSERKLSKDLKLAAKSSATVVVLMGMSKLSEIADIYLSVGKGDLPVAIIKEGTKAEQKEVVGTIQNIVEISANQGMAAPAIIVIGEVVHLAGVKKQLQEEWILEDEFIFQNLNTLPFVN
ncbi:uroporphyrinogen-III C-methyltransferase [Algoriphagus halophytocola]|uniref:uroporphyrinogen-III C-methyltransferase n=1 Tax=Algoriphagus halophytocola TaxID=2991499 RepID=A0ABY6MCS8_9BACT|nr:MULTISPECIES: uroporphyrinogen-III C-methyltransferase [unclassified Algoriphagus]UZD21495.1 uroporphyrinogen-III C-methyltransferase [Algoriphagus sp. TR-M5]WBL42707.1 uroporphyrinogen-III C-methyltransferase [Algoriphagus sp. TR-M9]